MAEYAEIEKWAMDNKARLRRYMDGRGCHSDDDYDDVFQDCLIAAFRTPPTRCYKTWFAQVMKNRWSDVRSQRTAVKRPVEVPLADIEIPVYPDWKCIDEETQLGLQRLTGRRLRAVLLRARGASMADGGEAMGCSPLAFRKLLYNARLAANGEVPPFRKK